MIRIATRQEMQAIDAYSIHEIGIPGMVLMEKASMALYEEVVKHLHRHSRSLIVVEKGNNGGDGLALGRLLTEAGYDVTIYEIGGIKKASESYLAQRRILEKMGISLEKNMPEGAYDVIIDGIFGVGLTRAVTGIQKEVIEYLNKQEAYRIAIGVPSGVDASAGKVLGTAFMADLTVTFGLSKIGLLLYPGAFYAGEVVVKDIGFPKMAVREIHPGAFSYEPGDEEKLPKRNPDSNKGTYGKVLVVAGSKNMSGAAYLCGNAAYRMGSGLVQIFTEESNRQILQTQLPEAILTTYQNTEEGKDKLKNALSWASVVVFGPGRGRGSETREFLKIIKENAASPIIFDADGLNEIGAMEEEGERYLEEFSVPIILTPHMLEMSRLSGDSLEELKKDRISLAQRYAKEKGVVLVLKDSRTIVTEGKEALYLNQTGNNGMSTGGSGDVLAGMIAGTLATGMEPMEGAAMGVFLHGRCGDEAAKLYGERSLLAGDIIGFLGKVLADR